MNVIVYTAVYGPDVGGLNDPTVYDPDIQYIAFTDQPGLRSSVWQIHKKESNGCPRCQARRVKLLPQCYLPPHTWSLWLDNRYTLRVNPKLLINMLANSPCDCAAFRHPDRNSLEDEAAEIIRLNKAPAARINDQLKHYTVRGLTHKVTTLTSSGLFLRKDTGRMRCFNRDWCAEVLHWSLRDQMSLDICRCFHKIPIFYLPGNYHCNPYATWRKHGTRHQVKRRKPRKNNRRVRS